MTGPGRESTPLEQRRRRQARNEARHSTELEGGRTDPVTRALQERYVTGGISIDELGAELRRLTAAGL